MRILGENKQEMVLVKISLVEVMDAMKTLFKDRLESSQIELKIESVRSNENCLASRPHTIEIMISLIQNAIDHLEKEPRGESLSVRHSIIWT